MNFNLNDPDSDLWEWWATFKSIPQDFMQERRNRKATKARRKQRANQITGSAPSRRFFIENPRPLDEQ